MAADDAELSNEVSVLLLHDLVLRGAVGVLGPALTGDPASDARAEP
ncbi:hypothetical protein [Streptomyces fractus]